MKFEKESLGVIYYKKACNSGEKNWSRERKKGQQIGNTTTTAFTATFPCPKQDPE